MSRTWGEFDRQNQRTYYAMQYAPQIKEREDKLKLTEEKRRLLTCVIELMIRLAYRPSFGEFPNGLNQDMALLNELHKRINAAATMEELAIISGELAKFKQEHPKLEG